MTDLLLRATKQPRQGGNRNLDDFDVFDGNRRIGRIYRTDARQQRWFWGVKLRLTGRNSYGTAASLDEAKELFKTEYERWKRDGPCWR